MQLECSSRACECNRVVPMVLCLARRRSGEQLGTPSVSNRPQMFTSLLLSPRRPPFLLQCPSTSLPSERVQKKKRELATLCSSCGIGYFCCQLFSCAFPRFCPRCGQSGEEATKLCSNNLDEPLKLKMEISVFLKGFSSVCYWTVFVTLLHPWTKKPKGYTKSPCFYGEADVGMKGQRNKRSRRSGEEGRSVAELAIK